MGPILCTLVPGICTSVCYVKWAHLVSVMQDEVFCVFLLHIVLVFSLFRVWVLLALLNLNKLLHKHTETDVAFTLEYSRVSNPWGTIKRDQT